MTQRDTPATVEWLQTHETTAEIGFSPDGMCQKIARTARNIGPGAASAFASQHMTPTQFRQPDVSKIKRGSVIYFDDPADDNPFGHVVTLVGRDRDADRGSLSSLLCRTNAVVSGRVVVVRGDYFGQHWGDSFQFAGEWLNGEPLDLPEAKHEPKPPPTLPARGVRRLEHMVTVYDQMIDHHRGTDRIVRALRRDRSEIRETIRTLKEKGKH